MSNVWMHPEKFGLTTIGEIDFLDGYEFDITVVFRTPDGSLAWSTDSGCSCPTPFDGVGLDDLTYGTPSQLHEELRSQARSRNYRTEPDPDVEPNTEFDAAIADLMSRVTMGGDA